MNLAYLFDPNKQFQDLKGVNNVAGFLRVYYEGTDDRATTYKNFIGTLNPADIPIDNYGRAVVIVEDEKTYRLEVYSRHGNLMWTTHPVSCVVSGGGPSVYVPEHFFLKETGTPIDVNSQTYGHTLPIFNINKSDEDKPDYVGDFIHHYDDPDHDGDILYVYLKPGAYRLSTRCRFYFKGERSGIAEIITYFGSPTHSAWHYVDSSVDDYVSVYDECNFRVPDTVEYQPHYCAFGCDKNVNVWLDEFNITKI